MKEKIIIIWAILIIFLWLNYNNFLNYYYNSFWVFEKSGDIEWEYNLATKKYLSWSYNESIKSFFWVLDSSIVLNDELLFRTYHNLWNTYYKLWYYEKSIDSYESALDINFDEETNKNLEFVKSKLNQEKQEEDFSDKKDEEEQDNDEQNNENERKIDNLQEDKWEKNKDKQNNESGNSEKKWQEEKDWGLSEQTKKSLEEISKKLQEQQAELWNFYNKRFSESNDPFEQFDELFDNPFFDNSLLEKDDDKKDW